MLEALRSFVTGWVAKILLILLVGSFALWGVSGSILGGANSSSIVQVGETSVGIREFLSNYNRNMSEIQRTAGRRLTREEGQAFGIESRTIGSLVSLASLDEYARINGLSLSDDMMAKLLAENPQFQDSTGKFNREIFRSAVSNAQMRESDYIDLQNQSAIRGQITQAFASEQILPDVFKNALGEYANEERKFSHITITPTHAGKPTDPTDAQLKTYFDANVKKYAAPEYRKLEILKVEPKDIANEQSVSDEEIAADYEARKTAYETPQKRRVQQIVFKSQENADAAIKALEEGAVFETILNDNGLSVSDADLGLLAKNQLPKKLQETAFSLPLNEPSKILDGAFGPTMIRVTDMTEASITPLEEVKDEIRSALALSKAADAIVDMQETIEDSRAGGTPLSQIAEKTGLTVRTIEAIDRTAQTPDQEVITDLPASQELLQQAFNTQVGAQASPLDVNSNGYVWYDVLSIEEARDRTLDEVKDRLKTDWLADQQLKLVEEKAQAFKQRLEKGANLSDIATELGVEVKTTGFLKRNGGNESFSRAATRAGFSGDGKNIAITDAPTAGEKMLIVVAERKGTGVERIDVPQEQVQLANQGAADDLLTQLIGNLQGKYAVTQNPALINQVLTQGGARQQY